MGKDSVPNIFKTLSDTEICIKILENVYEGIILIEDNVIFFANKAFIIKFNYQSVENILGKNYIDFFNNESWPNFSIYIHSISPGQSEKLVFSGSVFKDNKKIWFDSKCQKLEADHDIIMLTFFNEPHDITVKKLIYNNEECQINEKLNIKSLLKDRYRFRNIIGKSSVMMDVYEQILNASSTDANVIIQGDTGTGKELVAKAIHDMSDRSAKAYVPVNCSAIPGTLLESEFFGYRKGAFTGAMIDKHGFLRAANDGTLFLDEVAEFTISMQAKLLRAIETHEYIPIGATCSQKAYFRLISATNRNLMEMIKDGLLREDFYYRIAIIPITLPALRDRKEDLPLLIDHFISLYSKKNVKVSFSHQMMDAIYKYDWPGNVRELQNVVHRFIVTGQFNLPSISNVTEEITETGGGGGCYSPTNLTASHRIV